MRRLCAKIFLFGYEVFAKMGRMRVLMILCFLSVCLGVGLGAPLPQGEGRQVAVFVALCDNEHQGIAPVPPAIGRGDDVRGNLYWGCGDALPKVLSRSAEWQKPSVVTDYDDKPAAVLQAVVSTRKDNSATLTVFAYRGDSIVPCMRDFEAALVSGKYELVGYLGHNGLMDAELPEPAPGAERGADAMALCCMSREYFEPRLHALRCRPMLLTQQLMYPAGAVMLAAIDTWLRRPGDVDAIRKAAGQAYAANQRIGLRAAIGVFADLLK